MGELSVQCENKESEEAFKRTVKAISNLSEAFHELVPNFEKGVYSIRKLADYVPIPVEGKVE